MQKLDEQRIETIIRFIDGVEKDLENTSLEDFNKSDLLVRATCFSLVQIGEHMNRLEKKIGTEYPNLPWSEAIKLRNLVVHVYNQVKSEIIYEVAKIDLPKLKANFLKII